MTKATNLKDSSRSRVDTILEELRKSQTAEGYMIREAVGLLYENAKEGLVSANVDDMMRRQGEARRLKWLHDRLTRPSPLSGE